MSTTPTNKPALRFRRNPFDVESAVDPTGTGDIFSQQARIEELEERNRELGIKALLIFNVNIVTSLFRAENWGVAKAIWSDS